MIRFLNRIEIPLTATIGIVAALIFGWIFLISPALAETRTVCFGNWVWQDDTHPLGEHWEPPAFEQTLGAIDFRSIPQQSVPGPRASGIGVFVYANNPNLPELTCFENVEKDTDIQIVKNQVQNLFALSEPIESNRFNDIIFELLTSRADPTGLNAWKPLRPDHNKRLRVELGGFSEIKNEEFSAKKYPVIIDAVKHDFSLINDGSIVSRKVLFNLAEKYGVDWRVISPRGPPPIPPETAIIETFNQGDSQTLGPNHSWTELESTNWQTISNELDLPNDMIFMSARADTDLSSADHTVKIEFTQYTPQTSATSAGLSARYDSSAITYYAGETVFDTNTSAARQDQIRKSMVGVPTVLNFTAHDPSPTAPFDLELTVDGSNITYISDGQSSSTTDTAITDNLRCGVFSLSLAGARGPDRGDDWTCEDLIVAPTISNVWFFNVWNGIIWNSLVWNNIIKNGVK